MIGISLTVPRRRTRQAKIREVYSRSRGREVRRKQVEKKGVGSLALCSLCGSAALLYGSGCCLPLCAPSLLVFPHWID